MKVMLFIISLSTLVACSSQKKSTKPTRLEGYELKSY